MNMSANKTSADAALYEDYSKIPAKERMCLNSQAMEWGKTQALQGKKILFTGHYTRITLQLLDLLILAGADVYYTFAPDLVRHQDTLDAINKSSLKDKYIPYNELEKFPENHFDVGFDCGAYLVNKIKPKTGLVELTYTNPQQYAALPHPTISVDMNKIKGLETFLGTGDGFVRAVATHYKNNTTNQRPALYDDKSSFLESVKLVLRGISPQVTYFLNSPSSDTRDKYFVSRDIEGSLSSIIQSFEIITTYAAFYGRKYVVFGYGKVGQGICDALVKRGVRSEDITVVDISEESYLSAQASGFKALCPRVKLPNGSYADNLDFKAEIQKCLKEAYCAVTATGVKDCISTYYDPNDFPAALLKVNMGTYNEWGPKFKQEELLNNGSPANFAEEYPTQVRYLDGIFKLLLKACEFLVKTDHNKLKNDIQPMPAKYDQEVLEQWQGYYPEELQEADVKRFFSFTPEELEEQDASQAKKNFPVRRESSSMSLPEATTTFASDHTTAPIAASFDVTSYDPTVLPKECRLPPIPEVEYEGPVMVFPKKEEILLREKFLEEERRLLKEEQMQLDLEEALLNEEYSDSSSQESIPDSQESTSSAIMEEFSESFNDIRDSLTKDAKSSSIARLGSFHSETSDDMEQDQDGIVGSPPSEAEEEISSFSYANPITGNSYAGRIQRTYSEPTIGSGDLSMDIEPPRAKSITRTPSMPSSFNLPSLTVS